MTLTIEHEAAVIEVEENGSETRRVAVRMKDPSAYSPRLSCHTRYPLDLIKAILQVKGPAWLCDEIARDEDPEYVQSDLMVSLLSYVGKSDFDGKLIMDFGCGSGASTVIIARTFPGCRVLGVELDEKLLAIARLRMQHYRLRNVEFLRSPAPDQLPKEASELDFVLLSAVWEHLLPSERPVLLLKMWESLRPSGVLFINQTPDARFPIETHTTLLPLLNYLPDRWALWYARKFAKTVPPDASWEVLLRMGVRGGTPGEIVNMLRKSPSPPLTLRPNADGVKRQSDIYYRSARKRLSQRYHGWKRFFILRAVGLAPALGVPIAPYISLAIRRPREKQAALAGGSPTHRQDPR
jgi:SAM-dependent methyltransferase